LHEEHAARFEHCPRGEEQARFECRKVLRNHLKSPFEMISAGARSYRVIAGVAAFPQSCKPVQRRVLCNVVFSGVMPAGGVVS
jgi:hypothetical protein